MARLQSGAQRLKFPPRQSRASVAKPRCAAPGRTPHLSRGICQRVEVLSPRGASMEKRLQSSANRLPTAPLKIVTAGALHPVATSELLWTISSVAKQAITPLPSLHWFSRPGLNRISYLLGWHGLLSRQICKANRLSGNSVMRCHDEFAP